VDWTTLPSLWWQLDDALRTGLENSTHASGSKYRTPLNIDALQLAGDIEDVTTDALNGHDQKPRATFPESLRALASVVVAAMDADLTGWWTYRVRSWARQIDHVPSSPSRAGSATPAAQPAQPRTSPSSPGSTGRSGYRHCSSTSPTA
jgi:hypothetical protein